MLIHQIMGKNIQHLTFSKRWGKSSISFSKVASLASDNNENLFRRYEMTSHLLAKK